MNSRRYCIDCEQSRRGMRTNPALCSHCQRPFRPTLPSPVPPDAETLDLLPMCACGAVLDDDARLAGATLCTRCGIEARRRQATTTAPRGARSEG
jgi:hypothetical protein